MKLKGATIYSIEQSQADEILVLMTATEDGFDDAIRSQAKEGIGNLEMSSIGFVHPVPGDDAVSLSVGQSTLLCVEIEKRILPPDYVRRQTEKRVKKIEAETGEAMKGAARGRVREEVVAELIPHAPIKTKRIYCWIDVASNTFWVGAISRPDCEAVVSLMRAALGSFRAAPLNAELGVSVTMGSWLSGVEIGEQLRVADSCKLEDAESGVITMKSMSVLDEGAKLVDDGMRCTRVGLECVDLDFRFIVDTKLVLSGFDMGDVAMEANKEEAETAAQAMAADFAIWTGVLSTIYARLSRLFKFTQHES